MNSANRGASQYGISFILLPLLPSCVKMFSSVPCFQTLSFRNVKTKFCANTDPQGKIKVFYILECEQNLLKTLSQCVILL